MLGGSVEAIEVGLCAGFGVSAALLGGDLGQHSLWLGLSVERVGSVGVESGSHISGGVQQAGAEQEVLIVVGVLGGGDLGLEFACGALG